MGLCYIFYRLCKVATQDLQFSVSHQPFAGCKYPLNQVNCPLCEDLVYAIINNK
jgi:hypothetical protein